MILPVLSIITDRSLLKNEGINKWIYKEVGKETHLQMSKEIENLFTKYRLHGVFKDFTGVCAQ